MHEAALSRRMLAQARSSTATRADDGARGYLQARLEVYSRVMFWAFVVLRVLEVVLYRVYPDVTPRNYRYILATGGLGLVAMALCWRGVLARRSLSLRALGLIDLFYTASSGIVFGITAVLAHERPDSAFTCLIYACFVVFMRALVLPSSARWTALVSACAMAPLVSAAGVLATLYKQEIPPSVYFISALLFSMLAVVVATIGSHLIYGLRRRVSANMRLGQYTLVRKIGEGGMGTVFQARHALLRRPTAVKLLHPSRVGVDALVRFEREVQHMSLLTHPNTAAVYDYGHSPDGVFYYVMEYLDGIDLERLVHVHGRQPEGRVIDILIQVCGALHEAHLRGLVHRDVKPANIILCERGGAPDVAKVVDFGLAREIDQVARHAIVGTPAYIAPEAFTNADAVGPPADLYALGAVGYFLLTGRCVFDGTTTQELSRQHLESVPAVPGIAPELESILLGCLAKDPAERPASAAALADQLRHLPRGTWERAAARTWWSEFRSAAVEGAPLPSQTITVDLGVR